MSTTPNLLIPLISQSQNNKEITFNTAIDILDESLCGNKSEALPGTTFTMPTNDFQQNWLLTFTGALSGDCTITLPAGYAKQFAVINKTTGGHNLIFQVGTNATTKTISDANLHLMYSDGASAVYGS
jgi:hypothetical protein